MGNGRRILKIIIFFAILIIAISLRAIDLDKGYNSDEGIMLSLAKATPAKLMAAVIEESVYPPLSYYLLHLWIKIGRNDSEPWVRSYFVIFGIGVCLLVYLIANAYLNSSFGLIAFFIAATSPFLIWASQFLRSYIDSCFWALLSTFFMLLILKGDVRLRNKVGYTLSTICGLYTFYFNIFIVLSQGLYFMFTNYKQFKKIRDWLFLQLITVIMFIPGIFMALSQTKNVTAVNPQYGAKGFQIFGLQAGQYARGIAALFGIDPAFLFIRPLVEDVNKSVLIAMVFFVFFFTALALIYFIRSLRALQINKGLALFFPLLPFSIIAVYSMMVEFFYFPFNVKYLISAHAIFIGAISASVYYKINRKVVSGLLLAAILLVYAARWEEARMPEFETKKAYNFISAHMDSEDVFLMVRNTNYYLDLSSVKNHIVLGDSLIRDPKTGNYLKFSPDGLAELNDMASSSRSIWFYRNYGNDELFDANKLVMDWFKNNGYEIYEVKKFKRIDLINYKKRNF